jgi:hypothetical protein
MGSISFFTPVDYGDQPKSFTQSILESVDHYFYLGGKKAQVIPGMQNERQQVELVEGSQTLLKTCLKVASYFTLVLPLILGALKLVLRTLNTYDIVGVKADEKQKTEFKEESNSEEATSPSVSSSKPSSTETKGEPQENPQKTSSDPKPPEGPAKTFITISFKVFQHQITPFLSAADLVKSHTTNRFFYPLLDQSIVAMLHRNCRLIEFGGEQAKAVSLLKRIGSLLTRVNLWGFNPIDEQIMPFLPNVKHLTTPYWPSIEGMSGELPYKSFAIYKNELGPSGLLSIKTGQLKNVENLSFAGEEHFEAPAIAVAIQGVCLAKLKHLRIERLKILPDFYKNPWKLIQTAPQLEKLELLGIDIKEMAGENIDDQYRQLSAESFGLNPDRDIAAQLDRLPVWGLKMINFINNRIGNSGALLLLRLGAAGKLPLLESLELGSNGINSQFPNNMIDLTQAANKWSHLRFLGLTENIISMAVLRIFATLAPKIEQLDLGRSFSNTVRLVDDHFPFAMDDFVALVQERMFLELRILNLFNLTFSNFTTIDAHLPENGLPRLAELILECNELPPEVLTAFATMAPHIQHLKLAGSGIQLATIVTLAGEDRFRFLETLDLSRCLKSFRPRLPDPKFYVGKLPRLYSLDLSQSEALISADIELIGRITPVMRLLKASTSFRGAPLLLRGIYKPLLNLNILSLENVLVDETAIAELVNVCCNTRLNGLYTLSLKVKLFASSYLGYGFDVKRGNLSNLHTLHLPSEVQPRLLRAFIAMAPSLTDLELFTYVAEDNPVIDESLVVIAEEAAGGGVSSLRRLNLDNNMIGKTGCEALFGQSSFNSHSSSSSTSRVLFSQLREISLTKTGLIASSFQVILNSLKQGRFPLLRSMKLFDDKVSEADARPLRAFAKKHRIEIQ